MAQVEVPAQGIVGMVYAETQAAKPLRLGIPGADRTPPAFPARHAGGGGEGEAGILRCRLKVVAVIDEADAHCDRLCSLQGAAVGVLAVPGESGGLVGSSQEALRNALPCYEDLEINPLQA